jgi:hypothetical protein
MPAVIQCPSCQKEYPWKPDLAGKRVKCKCGELIDVPAAAPKAEVDELYDLADDPAPKGQHAIGDLQSAATTAAVAVDNSRHFPCPYCGEKLDPGSTMCPFCGSNLEGALPESAVISVPTAVQAAPPVATRPVVMRKPPVEESSARLRLAIIGILTIFLLAIGIFLVRRKFPSLHTPDAPVNPLDAPIVEKLDRGAEAREWLKADESRALCGMSHKQSVFKVDQWYDLGIQRAVVFGNGSSLGIELPSDPAKRKAVFEFERKWNGENNFPLVDDRGQNWLEIEMHL